MWRLLCAQLASNEVEGSSRQWARTWRAQYNLKNSRARLYNKHVAMACPTAKGKRLAYEYRDLVKGGGEGGGEGENEGSDGVSKQHSKTFSYGEIPFESFEALFALVRAVSDGSALRGTTFVDLGSGTGKAVISAALLGQFRECRGIELVENLHAEAIKLKEEVWNGKIKDLLHSPPPRIEFCRKDLAADDWASEGVGMVYACSTMFTPDLMKCIGRKASLGLGVGAVVVTLTKPLDLQDAGIGGNMALRCETWLRMSWGPARVFVYERV